MWKAVCLNLHDMGTVFANYLQFNIICRLFVVFYFAVNAHAYKA